MKHIFFILSLCLLFMCSCVKQTPAEVKVMTLNVRIDAPSDSMNNWQYRKDSISAFIHKNDFDILGLQEVYHNQMEDLHARLPEYASVGVGRVDGKEQGEYSPVFYKKDKYTLLDSNTFWISEFPDSVGTRSWDSAFARIATWAKLKDNKSGKVLLVLNTHLDHVGVEARHKGAQLIIERLKNIASPGDAVIATGDFNFAEQEKAAYEAMTTNEFVMKDSHKIAEKSSGAGFTFHDFGRLPDERRKKIDYVFVSPDIKVVSSNIFFDEIAEGRYLSDHNPILVDMILN